MQRIWQFLLDPRTLGVIGIAALAGLLFLGADAMRIGLVWAAVVLGLLLLAWAIVWGVRRYRAHKAAQALEQAMDAEADKAVKAAAKAGQHDEVAAVRERMAEAVKLIKSSKLGETSGSAALYELPWYAVIGNPAAGKSSAVVKSGLKFPFADSTDNVIQGIGGTRHCDWYFTTEGILLDTAGRYSVHEEDRKEWMGFLSLLKKHRPKAPLNGVIIAVSVAELGSNKPEFAIDLARKLRQRVQELTEKLEVFAPVYVVFTKADLIAGFVDFFEDRDRAERDKVWGATLPYDTSGASADAVAQFETHFDELYQGLKEASIARMSLHRGEQLPPGVLTFPLEFAALKPALRTFINTLFEENPYQFRPIFRGFYFTSAVQEGQSTSRASERVAEQFGLQLQPGTSAAVYAHSGFFLKELFSRVIFADRQLVQQYTSRTKLRLRYATFFGGVLLLGALMAAWTWSYLGNRELVAHVQADLAKAQQVQDKRVDLQSRLEALEILQDRLEQMQRYRQTRPWSIGLGLYQGQAIEARLKEEYFNGLQVVMLQPTAQAIAAYLADVNAHAADLRPLQRLGEGVAQQAVAAVPAVASASAAMPASMSGAASAPVSEVITENAQGEPVLPTSTEPSASDTPYVTASSTNVTEAYNALKAYLMLGDRERLEPSHMSDQLTRFWRTWLDANRGNMPREQLIRRAEHILSYAMVQMNDPAFPQLDLNLSLLDQTRDNLRRVIKGMPARERVYAEIKARAATRFASVTVARLVGDADRDVVAGGYAVSGAFTREAWQGYVRDAIKDAANSELHSTDWVLKTNASDDLTLEGSPEQIQKALTQLYKADYVREWRKFMQGIGVQDFGGFDAAVAHMNRLGDPVNSPVGVLLQTLYDQTSWDNPNLLDDKLAQGKRSFFEWFKQTILGAAPSPVAINVNMGETGDEKNKPLGPIGKEFVAVSRLMAAREGGEPMLKAYLASLSKIRSRFNQMKTQGDAGPASRQLMAQTLEGSGELAEALKLVDEQLLNGVGDAPRAALRPLLVRPLMQAFAVVVKPTEAELNRVWMAQVFEPYQRTLATKYPFDRSSRMEAAPVEIAKVFGAEGVVAKFVEQSLGTLVLKRGDSITPRTWADMGVRLRPEFVAGLGSWVAPLNGQSAGGGSSGAAGASGGAATEAQTVFQILPLSAPGMTEYTVDIDGQVMRYRNGAASWSHFVWPGPGTPGVHITGMTLDGKTVEFFNEPGRFGLEKMINAAQRKRIDNQVFELRWPQGTASVGVQLRIISNAATPPPAAPPAPTANSGGAGNGPVSRPGALPSIIAGQEEVAPAAPTALVPATPVTSSVRRQEGAAS